MQRVKATAIVIVRVTFVMLALGALAQPFRPTHGYAQLIQPETVGSREWNYEVDEVTLNTQLNTWSTTQPALTTPFGSTRLESLSVHMRDQVMQVRGTTRTQLFAAEVELATTASVENGRVVVQLHSAQVNGVHAPDIARGELERYLQRQLDASLAMYQLELTSIGIDDGKLVLSGTRT